MQKNNISLIERALLKKDLGEKRKKVKMVAMVAPSFVSTFDYPRLINQLKELGFEKVVELTFGAKMVNREYHRILEKNPKAFFISSTCPGIVSVVKEKYPRYAKNLIKVDSPMIAMGKICRKIYPKYKICFISPCEYKKREAEDSKNIDYVIDYRQLQELFNKNKIKGDNNCAYFDKFYNDYTKIYPLSGGLSKTANVKGVLKPEETKIIDGIKDVMKFLDNPNPKIRFLDCTFCVGGCIGGPYTAKIPLIQKKKRLMKYMQIAEKEKIPVGREGLIKKAKGIRFVK